MDLHVQLFTKMLTNEYAMCVIPKSLLVIYYILIPSLSNTQNSIAYSIYCTQ